MNTGVRRKGSCIHEMRAWTLKANHSRFSHIPYFIRFTISVNVGMWGGWINNKKKPPLVISLWLLTGSLPVSGQACGMSSSGSLLCFLFPPLSSCHFPWQTNNPAVKLDADCQGNSVSLGERSPRSPHSWVKYYPCACGLRGERRSLWIVVYSGGAAEADCLVAGAAAAARERPITSWFLRLTISAYIRSGGSGWFKLHD